MGVDDAMWFRRQNKTIVESETNRQNNTIVGIISTENMRRMDMIKSFVSEKNGGYGICPKNGHTIHAGQESTFYSSGRISVAKHIHVKLDMTGEYGILSFKITFLK